MLVLLLQEKMKQRRFSPNERIVVDFILDKQEQIEPYSTKSIAGETYTSPSVLIRIAKKLNFNGWNDFKQAFLEEVHYLQSSFSNLDANKPFSSKDSPMAIAAKITQLKIESANDTLSLLKHDTLRKAVRILEDANNVKVFGLYNTLFLGEEFVHKLKHINKRSEIVMVPNALYQEATMMTSDECAVCLSYSGETGELLDTCKILRENKVPIIAITSIGENSLSRLADVTLRVSTREASYSKIGGFSSLESISLILDILYSSFFAIHYQENYDYKIGLARRTEHRQIQNQIIDDQAEFSFD
ncbi:MurR/RpiR family transcriptional regulator [Enterococcus pallens]|uniref:MurR/RpiR family transcriptional regulator n=1 Tax=Enterococcus pallens TaxID=160454 RepID=UPI00091801A4|nr:hypothetical protein RV10_GL004196 [Enterococcus pallens]